MLRKFLLNMALECLISVFIMYATAPTPTAEVVKRGYKVRGALRPNMMLRDLNPIT